MKSHRPKFSRPPLFEQAISVVFERLEAFTIGDFGAFWAAVSDTFTSTEAQPLIEAAVEQFSEFRPSAVTFQIIPHEELPRCVYRTANGDESIQIQRDRFVFNWSHAGGGEYPHFEATKQRFDEMFDRFHAYCESRELGPIVVRQCELTNVNIVPLEDLGGSFTGASEAFRMPAVGQLDKSLEPETVTLQQRFIIRDEVGKPAGRLHLSLYPVKQQEDSSSLALRFELTARSVPDIGSNGVESFFTLARSAINAAFVANTTEWAHSFWGMEDV